jgi:predicted metal-dependent hydrolase
LNDPFELPSLEQIEEMEKQRSQAIEALQIIDHSVKCQKCGIAVPIVGKLINPTKGNRIAILQKRIKWIENYSRGNINRPSYHINEVKALKAELADLLEKDAKADKLRRLPLYSCKITGGNSYVQSVMMSSTTTCYCSKTKSDTIDISSSTL